MLNEYNNSIYAIYIYKYNYLLFSGLFKIIETDQKKMLACKSKQIWRFSKCKM